MPVHQLDHRTGTYTIDGIVQPDLGRPPCDLPPPTSVPEPTPLVQPGLEQLVLSGEVELCFTVGGGVPGVPTPLPTPLPARDIAPDAMAATIRTFETLKLRPLNDALDGWLASPTPMEAEECDFYVREI